MPITKKNNLTNAAESNTGRYSQGGATDQFHSRLGWWERFDWTSSNDDISVIIDKRTEGRPDLVAHDVYGKANLQWFVLQYNRVVDINEEFVVGARLVLPTLARLQLSILTKSSGGFPATVVRIT